jgi:tRNA pseudouridine65 synthase
MPETLSIIHCDEHLIAINKPSGLLVHRSEIDRHETRFAVQLLRDQIGQSVYPVHRLDKPTSGVLLFALSSDCARKLSEIFLQHQIVKTYLAVVRGSAPSYGHIDHPLTEELDKYTDSNANQQKPAQAATTNFNTLAHIELAQCVDKYPSSRYSLVECRPQTGRKHQLRRHLKHINHPIIGDAKHGKGRHNRFFQEQFNIHRLLLAATQLELTHPYSGEQLRLTAPIDANEPTSHSFYQLLQHFNWCSSLPTHWISSLTEPLCD